MAAGEQQLPGHPAGADQLVARRTEFQPSQSQRLTTEEHRWVRRLLAALAWIGGCVVLFFFYLRISYSGYVTSDGANNALQAWDMLHGHLRLHGWIIGDATYYTFELPLLAITELFVGLRDLASHAASALTYLIVTVCAVAVALTGSRGPARVARAGVVVAVMIAMVHVEPNAVYLLEAPDHTGTVAFLLVSCLLIDRAPNRWFTAPLLCAILCLGQIGDATVRYVDVPTVVLVCGYRTLAARKVRTGDAASVLAAIVSMPLASAVRSVMLHFGAYQMVAPKTGISSPSQWPHNAALTWNAIRVLFGLEAGSGGALARDAGYLLPIACLLAAAIGFVRVIWSWRTASRAEQLLCTAIVVNIAAYVISTMPILTNPYEIVGVLPCGAVLAARACVPRHIAAPWRAGTAIALAGAAALLPLTTARAIQHPIPERPTSFATWAETHGLRYGLAGYWNSSVTTEYTGNRVQVRSVAAVNGKIIAYDWETDTYWYDPSRHDATFVIFYGPNDSVLREGAERIFGKPVTIHHGTNWTIWIYHKNLLKYVTVPPPSG
jgi:hypothetical protein